MKMVTKHAIFQIGEEVYGLDIMEINTVEKYIPVENAANAPKNVKGIIRLRGDVLPVYSLRRKFNLEEREPDQDTRLIITKSNGLMIAYEADRMLGIQDLEPEQLNEVPPILESKNTSYLKQITNLDGKLVALMDHDGILSVEELEGLRKLLGK